MIFYFSLQIWDFTDLFTPVEKYWGLRLLSPDPFPRMGAWRKTMEPQKPSNFTGCRPEIIERHRVVKKQAVQRVRNWSVQNKMRGVLDQMAAGGA